MQLYQCQRISRPSKHLQVSPLCYSAICAYFTDFSASEKCKTGLVAIGSHIENTAVGSGGAGPGLPSGAARVPHFSHWGAAAAGPPGGRCRGRSRRARARSRSGGRCGPRRRCRCHGGPAALPRDAAAAPPRAGGSGGRGSRPAGSEARRAAPAAAGRRQL